MSALQWKTRMQLKPVGKSPVYIACYAEDFSETLNDIAEDILSIWDCVTFYYEPDHQWAEPDLQMLRHMPVIVPITNRLLFMKQRPAEISYALEQQLPLIPILTEPVDMNLYSAMFGNIQFLDRCSTDKTTRPYKEKLKVRLDSWIIGPELEQRILDEFSANVFLSYRKMDRQEAQEVTKLIQQDDACQDIGVWYDEYLVSGEDFKEGISHILSKSDLFVLVATKNLLIPDNYVLETENPDAVLLEKEKRIQRMLIRIGNADLEQLDEKLFGLPDWVEYEDAQGITAMILQKLESHMRAHVKQGPKHDYLIGLAYLRGIRTEPQQERALKLIHKAANAGFAEAMARLADMYEDGDNVERDLKQSIQWRERLVLLLKEEYEASATMENAEKYLSQMEALGYAYCQASVEEDDPDAYICKKEDLSCDMHNLALVHAAQGEQPQWWYRVAVYHSHCAAFYFNQGVPLNLQEALYHAEDCRDILEGCPQGPEHLPTHQYLCFAYRQLGDIYHCYGGDELLASEQKMVYDQQAGHYYQKAGTQMDLCTEAGDDQFQDQQWLKDRWRGDFYSSQQQWDEALCWYGKAEKKLRQTPAASAAHYVGLYIQIGNVYLKQANAAYQEYKTDSDACKQAVHYFTKALKMHESLPNIVTDQFFGDRFLIHNKIATAYACWDDLFLEQVKLHYRLSLEIAMLWAQTGRISAAGMLSGALIQNFGFNGLALVKSAVKQIQHTRILRLALENILEYLMDRVEKEEFAPMTNVIESRIQEIEQG